MSKSQIDELAVWGYIHETEKVNKSINIPAGICDIIYSYYFDDLADLRDIIGDKFIKKDDKEILFEDCIVGNEIILFFFSADWCPPCRQFMPQLKEYYEKWRKDGVTLEIVWISSCSNSGASKEYFQKMGDWIAYPHDHPNINKLKKKYNVVGIPTLIAIDAKTCKTIDDKARMTVTTYKEQAYKQWLK